MYIYNDNSSVKLEGKTLDQIGHLTKLEILDLDGNLILLENLNVLKSFSNLSWLSLGEGNPLGINNWDIFSNLKNLKILKLNNTKLSSEQLELLSKTTLNLNFFQFYKNPDIGSDSLDDLGKIRAENISLSLPNLTDGHNFDQFVLEVNKHNTLKNLEVNLYNMSKEDGLLVLDHLSKLNSLEELNIGTTKNNLVLEAIEKFARIPNFNSFDFVSKSYKQEDLEAIILKANKAKLKTLNILIGFRDIEKHIELCDSPVFKGELTTKVIFYNYNMPTNCKEIKGE